MKGSSSRADGAIDRGQTDWYKDAIIYQLHVKAFQDSDDDGMGDFAGLMRRLDHVQELGATAIWLLPFYPSPLRDDGYDIADYKSINPAYGRMTDFRAFVAEAHRRGLRVITELVINHTSDQHPWFQKARHSPPGSAARDFYVWSDTDTKFPETRIIFLDTEKSNWTWDPVAGAFYWHRFYSHQPDLNFDNPRVLREVLKVMHFWLEMGVDGLRLDAIPYLIEREGTNNENLPETHEILKKIRAELDAHYADRMLLAEANQWPEDTRPYFGEGDECQMGFHFPLMPRMYMAVAQEDRHPITDIIRQTPEIPANCQWGIFLRNHDELTLEMVTDQERDYLWRTYAEDRRARINLGIRRRLAPLMQNDRRKIELLNSLLLSMPGTPILYYGDEIGMGDNYYLGDRDGVRTPMQWSSDRNAGFSRANPQQLFLPVIMDPNYGYQTINVESQNRDPSSLLNWMRRIVAVRKQHAAFGRGTMTLLYPRNRKVLAYVREHEGQRILCVANLSRAAQAVELDLSQWKGAVPIEMAGRSPFPPVGVLPYLVTLPAYGFYWFLLAEEAEAPRWHQPTPDILPEFVTLMTRDGRADTAFAGRDRRQFDGEVVPQFLALQRWFDASVPAGRAEVKPLASLGHGRHLLAEIEVRREEGVERYFLPMSARWGEENLAFGAPTLSYTLAKLRRTSRVGALVDGAYDADFAHEMLRSLCRGEKLPAGEGELAFLPAEGLGSLADPGEPLVIADGADVTVAFGDALVLTLRRKLRQGGHGDVEMARFLTETAAFPHVPAFLGSIEYRPSSGAPRVVATAHAFVRNQGSAWHVASDALRRHIEETAVRGRDPSLCDEGETFGLPFALGALVGRRTAELHRALARDTENPAFAVELANTGGSETRIADESLAAIAERLADRAPMRSRIHGDYRLDNLLVAQNDVVITGFGTDDEKASPLLDVATMLASIDQLALAVVESSAAESPERRDVAERCSEVWRHTTRREFIKAYGDAIEGG